MTQLLELAQQPTELARTWFLDLDGTLLVHNGYLQQADQLLPGAALFLQQIPDQDCIVITSARPEEYRQATAQFLRDQGVRWDLMLLGLPTGQRILVNDIKPWGEITAVACNVVRNAGLAGCDADTCC